MGKMDFKPALFTLLSKILAESLTKPPMQPSDNEWFAVLWTTTLPNLCRTLSSSYQNHGLIAIPNDFASKRKLDN